MKKLFLTLAMLLFAFTGVMRAGELTVYDGTVTNNHVPMYVYYFDDFTRSQFIIPATDLVEMTGGQISAMKFYTTNSNIPYTTVSTVEFYVAEVDYTTITEYIDKADAQVVYSGTVEFTSTQEAVITFNTPYAYRGGNLLIGCENITDAGYKNIYFYGQTVASASISGSNGSSTAGVPAQAQNFIPKTTFTYTGGMAPAGPTNIVTVPEVLDLGYLPMGTNAPYWMEPATFYFKNTGETGVVNSLINGTDALLPVEVETPFTLRRIVDSVMATVNYGYMDPANGPVAEQFVIDYTPGRGLKTFDISATPYAPAEGDVYELAKEVSTFPYTNSVNNAKKNYNIPGALANAKDAVYKVTFENASILNVNVTGNDPAVAIYTECFGGEDGPMADNVYTGGVNPCNPGGGGGQSGDASTFAESFESGMPTGWNVIDSNNDGYTWCMTSAIPTTWTYYSGQSLDWYRTGTDAICSGSYINGVGALTPDEYLVTPQVTLVNGSTFSFWAAATDASYPEDHFGVFVSDNGTSNWTMVSEWTMTAKGTAPKGGRETRDGNGLRLGTWYEYTVDLSAYAGQKYIAIRHFNCNDQYIMCVDDIALTAGREATEPTNTESIDAMYVAAGTYYIVAASTSNNFTVNMSLDAVPAPTAPVITDPVDGQTGITAPYTFAWTLDQYAEEMQVILGTQYPPTDILIDWTSELVDTYTIQSLMSSKTYFMQVKTRNGSGESASEIIGFTTAIAPVTGFEVETADLYPGDSAVFTWTASTRSLLGYNMYQDGVLLNEELLTNTRYVVNDLEHNLIPGYDFQVTAVYTEGESAPSTAINVRMIGEGTVTGTVFEQDSITPVASATVRLQGTDVYGATQSYTFTTDDNGVYTGQVYEGDYIAVASKDGYQNCGYDGTLTVVYDETVTDVNIYLYEMYEHVGIVTATEQEEENNVLVEWDWTPANMVVDFETGDFSQAEFTLPATYPWAISTVNPYEGTYCMKSTCEGVASGSSTIEATVEVPFDAMVGFQVKVSSEANYDKFHFYIDGVEQGGAMSGNLEYTYKEYAVTQGTHTYKWEYSKDGSVNSNDDCVYVDNITMYMPAPPAPSGMVYNFDNGTMMGWTNIDGDGDGNVWVSSANPGIYHNSGVSLSGTGHNSSEAYVISGSYANQTGQALTPNNYMVSPSKIAAQSGAGISFWACAQDASYAAEHFGVAVSTASNSNAADFTTIQEWTMTAKSVRTFESAVRGTRQGSWYQYTVDLSEYAGQEIWVAIRHFNCTDMFILNVDDITLGDGTEATIANMGNRSLNGYNLYRRNNNLEEPVIDTLAFVSADQVSYVDNDWENLSYGIYQWGVQAYYEGNAAVPENRATIVYDFENGEIPAEFVNTSTYQWTVVDGNGGKAMMSGNGGHASSSSTIELTYTFAVDGTISFDAECMGEGTGTAWDKCIFMIDGVEQFSYGAHVSGWNNYSYEVAAGEHTFTWTYSKDSSVNPTGDYFMVDNITIEAGVDVPTGSFDGLAEIIWSNEIEKDMYSQVTVNVSLNSGLSAQGATVTLGNYTATVDENGVAVLENVVKGDYTLTVALAEYSTYTEEVSIIENEHEFFVVLEEQIVAIENLYVSPTGWAMWNGGMPTPGPNPNPNPNPNPGATVTYDFDDGTMMGWTSIDGDNDGYGWVAGDAVGGVYLVAGASLAGSGHNASNGLVCSGSYSNATGAALTPNNFLVAPEQAVYSSVSFWACGQDASYVAEHFGVAVATAANPTASDFTIVNEWTMTAKELDGPAIAKMGPGRGGQTRAQGSWHEYTADLSAYAGQNIWVAIRHFGCTDMFILDVDDITLTGASKGERAALYYKVKLDGTYVGETDYTFYQHDVEGMEEGSEHTTEVAPVFATAMGDWASYTWIYTPCENYEGATDYTATANGSDVTLSWTLPNGSGPTPPSTSEFYDFNNSTMQGWTTIDANNDNYDWVLGSEIGGIYLAAGASLAGSGHNSSTDMVCSGSYSNASGAAITPDNYLVSPAKGACDQISFWACAQDASYAAEHFGVAVSTGSNTNASDFTMIQEWTMTAKDSGVMSVGRNGQTRAQGSWHEYTVDLSAYAGQDIWVAIRHFNCTDQFILNVDDITLGGGTPGPGPTPPTPPTGTTTYDFDDGTMMNWTSIDGDNDGYGWVAGDAVGGVYLVAGASLAGSGHNASNGLVCSGSYSNATGAALTPNNFLVSPAAGAYTNVSFWACGQDASYVAEHFGVAVATAANPTASDFTIVNEWTMTAKGSGVMSIGRDGQTRAQGSWHEYTADLSAYAGQNIWVAIRHFGCTDQFILDVDDITLGTASKGNRDMWDLVTSFNAAEAAQYGVASDGQYIYTCNWGYSSATHNFYKYDLQGNMIEGFDIAGCGTIRDLTYDGQFFYGGANASVLYCVDLANHTLVSQTSTSCSGIRHCTYDPVNDGFWVGGWSDLKLIDRSGATIQNGPAVNSVSGTGYFTAEDGSAHLYLFTQAASDAKVYDFDIASNSVGAMLFDFSSTPGYDAGSSGGAFIGDYNGMTCFFGDAQQSPNLIGIYELGGSVTPGPGPGPGPTPVPTGDVLGVMIFRDGELVAGPVSGNSYVDEGLEPGTYEYCIRVVYGNYAMACEQCETVEIAEVSCDPVTNLTGEYMVDATYGPGVYLEWEGNANAYGIYIDGEYLGATPDLSVFIYGFEADGDYTFGVVAIYDDCESDMETIVVYYDGVNENDVVNNIYPNPTSGMVKIEAQGMNHITVASALGQVVYDADVDADQIELNLGQYNAGLYLVRVSTVNGVSVKRVTVVK